MATTHIERDRTPGEADARGYRTPIWLAIVLIVTGAAGLLAAFTLSVERIQLLESPDAALGCDVSPFVSCSGAMESWQGELLGFPNPIIGLMAYPAVIIMGVLSLARVRMPRWVWTTFAAGVVVGLAFALWLWQQSIFVLGIVCPWCFVVYMAMSALTPTLVLWVLGSGAAPVGDRVRRGAARISEWSWVVGLALAMVVVLGIVVRLPDVPRFLLGL